MKRTNFDEFENDRMIKDLANYKWGLFYFNRNDGRVMVPKYRKGMGWTLNFGNFNSYLLIFGVILVLLIFKYLG
jgi:uncharacterized membrane protein